jgi:hypothetical protein
MRNEGSKENMEVAVANSDNKSFLFGDDIRLELKLSIVFKNTVIDQRLIKRLHTSSSIYRQPVSSHVA